MRLKQLNDKQTDEVATEESRLLEGIAAICFEKWMAEINEKKTLKFAQILDEKHKANDRLPP